MPEIVLTPAKLADLLVMKSVGWDNKRIAEEFNVSVRTIERHVDEFRKRAEEVGPHQAFAEVILNAGPTWGLFRFTPLRSTPEEIVAELRKVEEEK